MRALTFWLMVLAGPLALAQNFSGPRTIGYAGCATDANGTPYSGPQGVTVRLFDQASGGAALESFDFSNTALGSVLFTNGCFSVELDLRAPSSGALGFDQMDKPLFLEITVNGTVTYGRIPFDLVPYSAWAGAVHWADVRDRPNLVNTLTAGAGISLPDGGVGNAVIAVNFSQVQKILSPAGTCTGPNFVQSIDPVTGVVSCAFPGAPNVTVGPGLLVGSDGGLNGGSANTSVTGGTLGFGLNFTPANGTTLNMLYDGGLGTVDGGTILITSSNGSSTQVARADHVHHERVWLSPGDFTLADSSADGYAAARAHAVLSFAYPNTPAMAYPTMLLGWADAASAVVPMPTDFVPSRVVVRLSAMCPNTGSISYSLEGFGGTAPTCSNVTPALRFTAVPSMLALQQLSASGVGASISWTPVPFPPVNTYNPHGTIAQFTPMRVSYYQYSSPVAAQPPQLGDLLYVQLYNSTTTGANGAGWELTGMDLDFIP